MKLRHFSFLAILLSLSSAKNANKEPKPSEPDMFTFPTNPGKIMFYAPLVSRSMVMTFMPLAEALASRGHKVVAVIPLEYDAKTRENLEVITVQSRFEELFSNFSR